jgi:hypothetical protein
VSINWETRTFSARIAAYKARFVGKCLKTRASLIPAVRAISFVVVPLKPFAAKRAVAAEIILACRSRADVLVPFPASTPIIVVWVSK